MRYVDLPFWLFVTALTIAFGCSSKVRAIVRDTFRYPRRPLVIWRDEATGRWKNGPRTTERKTE